MRIVRGTVAGGDFL
jgi:hypothetical protein